MATDPGDLVLDPTCGCGTTALVAEQWGRRWITIDTAASPWRSLGRGSWRAAIPPTFSQTRRGAGSEEARAHGSRPLSGATRHPQGLRLQARSAHHLSRSPTIPRSCRMISSDGRAAADVHADTSSSSISPTRTRQGSGSPGRSLSRASRRTASSRPTTKTALEKPG